MMAGRHLFAEQGFDGVSVDAIARAAGVNKAMINYHFGGKNGLYLAILADLFDPVIARLTALADGDAPADEKLHGYFRMMLEMHHDKTRFPQMLIREVTTGGGHLDGGIRRRIAAVFDAVRRIIQQGIDDGTFRPVDPFLTYLALNGSLVFFFATQSFRERMLADHPTLSPEPPSPEEFVAHVEALYSRALGIGETGTVKGTHRRSGE